MSTHMKVASNMNTNTKVGCEMRKVMNMLIGFFLLHELTLNMSLLRHKTMEQINV